MNKDWILCKATFLDSDETSEIIGKEQDVVWEDFCFDIKEVDSFNRASEGTRINLKSGFDININIEFEDLMMLVDRSKT